VSLVYNERTKLLATALSNTGVATVVTAIVAPVVGFLYGTPAPVGPWWWLVGVVCLLVGVGLHILAQVLLGRLKP